jgi:hypothetical protein
VHAHNKSISDDSLVVLDLETRVFGDGDVVTPCRSRQVDSLCAGEESSEEGSTDSEGASSGDRLSDGKLRS